MDVRLTDEQRMFAKVIGSLSAELTAHWDAGRDRGSAMRPQPAEPDLRRMAEAGLFAVRLDEAAGGAGGTCVDVCVLVEQLGRHVVPAPALGTILLLEQLRVHGADPDLQARIAEGDLRAAPVLSHDLRGFAGPADLGRERCLAFDVAGAGTALAVGSAAIGSSAAEAPLGAVVRGIDLTREIATLEQPGSCPEHSGTEHSCPEHALSPRPDSATRATSFALAVLAADLLGVAGRALDDAVEHARTRTQFGSPIGSFQAVAHLLAEALVSVEAMRSAVWYAGWAVDALAPEEALRAARTAKAFTSRQAVEVTETAVQVLGGIGMTWESRAHLYQRRAHLDRRLFGDENAQYDELARG